MKRKRAPGGGRKPSGPFAKNAAQLTIRMPADMRKQLERSAAYRRNGAGWKLTQEMLYRLQRSFDREQDEKRDPAARALGYLLAEVISFVASTKRPFGELVTRDGDTKFFPNSNWRSDPFAFHAIRLAFNLILDALQPTGAMRPPRTAEQPLDGEAWILGERFPIPANTPEALAKSIRDIILFRLAREPSEFAEGSRSREGQWVMSQAAQALRLKRGTKR